MLCVVTEETERVIGERRLRSLRELAAELTSAGSEAQVLKAVSRSLEGNNKEFPSPCICSSTRGKRILQPAAVWRAPIPQLRLLWRANMARLAAVRRHRREKGSSRRGSRVRVRIASPRGLA